jgi:hypothetical protein
MPKTIAELAETLYVDPGDIETLLDMYPQDVEDLWSEEGVLSDLACDDLDRVLNPYGVRTAPELFPTLPVGVVMIPRRVARVAGDSLVHRHSNRTGMTRCGREVAATEKGEDVSEDETPCERCYDPDV